MLASERRTIVFYLRELQMTTYKLFGAGLIAMSLAVMGCDEHKKEKAKEEAHKVEEAASHAVDAVADTAKKAEEKIEHGVEVAKEKAHDAVDHMKHHEETAPATEHKVEDHKVIETTAAPADVKTEGQTSSH